MAVNKTDSTATLRLVLDSGKTNQNGEPVTKTKNFAPLKSSASDDAVWEIGQALADLQTLNLLEVVRLDQAQLINE